MRSALPRRQAGGMRLASHRCAWRLATVVSARTGVTASWTGRLEVLVEDAVHLLEARGDRGVAVHLSLQQAPPLGSLYRGRSTAQGRADNFDVSGTNGKHLNTPGIRAPRRERSQRSFDLDGVDLYPCRKPRPRARSTSPSMYSETDRVVVHEGQPEADRPRCARRQQGEEQQPRGHHEAGAEPGPRSPSSPQAGGPAQGGEGKGPGDDRTRRRRPSDGLWPTDRPSHGVGAAVVPAGVRRSASSRTRSPPPPRSRPNGPCPGDRTPGGAHLIHRSALPGRGSVNGCGIRR